MIIRITMTAVGAPYITQSQTNEVTKEALGKLGEEWHKKFRRSHFSQSAYSRYGYTPRSKAYNRSKKKHLGHTLPLVFTGQSRNLSEQKNVISTARRVKVRMPVRVFNFKSKNSKVDKSKEFQTVADFEHKTLNDNAVKNAEKGIGRIKTRKRLL